jgi:hypothetical protein
MGDRWQRQLQQQFIDATGRRHSEVSDYVQRLNKLERTLLDRKLKYLSRKLSVEEQRIDKLIKQTQNSQQKTVRQNEATFDLSDYEQRKTAAATTNGMTGLKDGGRGAGYNVGGLNRGARGNRSVRLGDESHGKQHEQPTGLPGNNSNNRRATVAPPAGEATRLRLPIGTKRTCKLR